MDLKAIFEDNINEYSDHVDCDVAENFESTTTISTAINIILTGNNNFSNEEKNKWGRFSYG